MVEITPAAKSRIIDLLIDENNPKLALRTFVQGGGCSGFSYGFTFDEEKTKTILNFRYQKKFIQLTVKCYCMSGSIWL